MYEMFDCILKLHWLITEILSDETVTKRSDRYLDLKTEQGKLVEDNVTAFESFTIATTVMKKILPSHQRRKPSYMVES